MKKIMVGLMALLVTATLVLAADYSPQLHNAKIYRVALGSGTAPTAADAAFVGIKPGDMVENTDDNVLYIMTATNAYVKIESDGAVTAAAGNIVLARMTNALVTGTLAANLTGNIADARMTNALATDGLNVPLARMTNAISTTIALAGTALQPGVCAVTATTNAGVATVLVTNSLASQTVMCGWLSTNAGGFATAVNLTSIAVDGNSLLYTAADNPSPIFRTHTDGKTTFTITFSAASTNCFNVVQRDGAIKSSGSILPSP